MTDSSAQEFHLSIDTEHASPVHLLADSCELSNTDIKQAMKKGAVWLTRKNHTQRLRRATKKLQKGDTLHFYFNERVLSSVPAPAELISDEGEYSVWEKPYGLFSQGSKWGDHCTLYRWAEEHLKPQRPAFTVHRLDRAASGLMLIAHSRSMAAQFSQLFRERKITKHYRVFVRGDFSRKFPQSMSSRLTIDEPLDNKHAISHIKFLGFDAAQNRSVLDVEIETGRKHQIRQHLAGVGYPIIGDRLYGKGEDGTSGDENLQLKAYRLIFTCPVSGEVKKFELDE